MNVRLVVQRGGRRGKAFPIRAPGAVLGRGQGSTIRIPSAEVSRHHCRIRLRDDVLTVEDLRSVNGTRLNGQPVRGTEVLRPGDQLQVGPVTFVVEYELSAQARAEIGEQEDEVLAALAAGDEDLPSRDEAPIPVVDLDKLEILTDGEPAPEKKMAPEKKTVPEKKTAPKEPAAAVKEEESIKPDFDFDDAAWQAPQGNDLRDILAQMEEEAEEEKKPRKKKPKPDEREE
jgi:pSer/pThr/pTyr-binding forkhead associated (FHA) protein